MNQWKLYQKALLALFAAAAAALIFAGVKGDRMMRVGAGYKAKIACSEIFLAGRDADAILDGEFKGIDPLLDAIHVSVDRDARETTAAGPLGLGRARAVYRDGYGCTLANAGRIRPLPTPPPAVAGDPWPIAAAGSDGALPWVDYDALNAAIDDAFSNNGPNHRALLVVVDGKIAAERYADGFTAETPFLSWSMGKSVIATIIGAAEQRRLVDVAFPVPVPEWSASPRNDLTWDDLLRMQSGLAFGEDYDVPRSDVNRMLFEMADSGALAASRKTVHAPGEFWSYSSGTTNMISKALRAALSSAQVDYHAFARAAVFNPIGAESFVMEPDASGNYVGSSFVYATARDWARLGQLYLQDGVWDGARILREGWTDYVAKPAGAADGEYGAHFWLNRDGASGRERDLPGLPEDVYYMSGHDGQYVFIVPSKRMIIVRLGMTRERNAFAVVAPTIEAIYASVSEAP